MKREWGTWALNLLVAAVHLYYVGIFGWVILYWGFGDRWWWLFLLNSFAVYGFLALPVPLALAVATRRREVAAGAVGVLVLGGFLFGRLWLPSLTPAAISGPELTVMTTNVLGFNMQPEGVVASIRESGADVVAIQELNLLVAEAIQRELADAYPYQVVAPENSVRGLGVISRYPLRETGVALEGAWLGEPQVLEVAWEGREVLVVNYHAIPPGPPVPESLRYTIRERERQAASLAELAHARTMPLILLGDLNATGRSDAYRILAQSLEDAWMRGGWGLGHTFPGAASPGSSRPTIAGIPAPKWLVRLDYVFYSEPWQVRRAWLGPWDGQSDHRPVMAMLVLEP